MTGEAIIAALADEFADTVRRWVAPCQLDLMRSRNLQPSYAMPICASHDFCDANEAMAISFSELRIDLWGKDGAMLPASIDLWNAAWLDARNRKLI